MDINFIHIKVDHIDKVVVLDNLLINQITMFSKISQNTYYYFHKVINYPNDLFIKYTNYDYDYDDYDYDISMYVCDTNKI